MSNVHTLDQKKSAPPPSTNGLNRLDQDRAASVADEGGATAATVESQEPPVSEKSGGRSINRKHQSGQR